MTFALAWPFAPSQFARHWSFRRLSLALFAYNLAVMIPTLALTRELMLLMSASANINRDTSLLLSQTLGWSEGLARYVIWMLANYPFARAFRDRFDADLLLSRQSSLIAPALLFGRPIFWASLVASLLYESIGSLLLFHRYALIGFVDGLPQLTRWMAGHHQFYNSSEFMVHAYNLLHLAAVSLFRAACVTYALFAGSRAIDAARRVIVAYCVGGLFLFTLYNAGDMRGMAAAVRAQQQANANLRTELVAARQWTPSLGARRVSSRPEREQFILRGGGNNSGGGGGGRFFFASGAIADAGAFLALTLSGPELRAAWVEACQELSRDMQRDAQRRIQLLQRHRLEFQFLFRQVYLIPYYGVCVFGGWFLLWMAGRRRRWLD